jgi:ZU5 domain
MSWLKKSIPGIFLAFAYACGVDQPPSPGPSGDDESIVLPDSLSSTIGPEGGEMKIRGVRLVIPQGALSSDTVLTLANLGDEATAKLAPLEREVRHIRGPTMFSPHRQVFMKPVHVEMTMTMAPTGITLRRLDDELDSTWEIIRAKVRSDGLEFETEHFSIYGLASALPEGTGGADSGSGGRPSASGGFSFGGGAAVGGFSFGGEGNWSSGGSGASFGGEAGARAMAGSAGEGS